MTRLSYSRLGRPPPPKFGLKLPSTKLPFEVRTVTITSDHSPQVDHSHPHLQDHSHGHSHGHSHHPLDRSLASSDFSANGELENDDRIAVLLMGYGEVERYEDFANYNEQALNLLTAKFAPVPTWVYPPLAKLLALFDLHEWGHQHHQFISPHNQIFEQQRAGIAAHLQARWGDRIAVFKAFNFCAPFLPTQVLAEIQAQGFTKLLIYPLLVVDSIFTSGIAVEQVNRSLTASTLIDLNSAHATSNSATDSALASQANPQEHWVKGLRYIPSFYDRPAYLGLMASLVEERIAADLAASYLPSQIGIILMNHGCPLKAKGFTSGIDESQALYEKVRERLIHRYPLISVGWLNHQTPLIEWTQPNVYQAARNLIDLGAKAVVLMPIGFATENHETLLDVAHIIESLRRKHPQVEYVQMPCVNDHPDFLQMAADWTHEHIEALLSDRHLKVNLQVSQGRSNSAHGSHSHGSHSHTSHSHTSHSHAHHF